MYNSFKKNSKAYEYLEKLNELKDAQYDSIEAYYDAQDAIKDLNEARVDEIKNGIEKQIKAYEKLIDMTYTFLDSHPKLNVLLAHMFFKSFKLGFYAVVVNYTVKIDYKATDN